MIATTLKISPAVLVVGIRRAVRRQRQRLDVIAHVRRIAAGALRVQVRRRRAHVPVRVPVKP